MVSIFQNPNLHFATTTTIITTILETSSAVMVLNIYMRTNRASIHARQVLFQLFQPTSATKTTQLSHSLSSKRATTMTCYLYSSPINASVRLRDLKLQNCPYMRMVGPVFSFSSLSIPGGPGGPGEGGGVVKKLQLQSWLKSFSILFRNT